MGNRFNEAPPDAYTVIVYVQPSGYFLICKSPACQKGNTDTVCETGGVIRLLENEIKKLFISFVITGIVSIVFFLIMFIL